MIERFTILVYHRTWNCINTNECRRKLFCLGKSIDNIPPTSVALWKHTLRSSYVAGHVWAQSLNKLQTLPPPEDWGWKYEDQKLVPHWTDLPEASVGVRDLVKCGCKNNTCRGNCKCIKTGDLPCTELCQCKGQCER